MCQSKIQTYVQCTWIAKREGTETNTFPSLTIWTPKWKKKETKPDWSHILIKCMSSLFWNLEDPWETCSGQVHSQQGNVCNIQPRTWSIISTAENTCFHYPASVGITESCRISLSFQVDILIYCVIFYVNGTSFSSRDICIIFVIF